MAIIVFHYLHKHIQRIIISVQNHNAIKNDDGKAIFLRGMVAQDKQVYDCYVKYSDEKQGRSFFRNNPDEPVQQQVQSHPNRRNRITTSQALWFG
ncbi:MAG: hypothetical protein SNG10_01870, partial [Rikenellaceae bacterium]